MCKIFIDYFKIKWRHRIRPNVEVLGSTLQRSSDGASVNLIRLHKTFAFEHLNK
jgi:hypothetical protein